MDKLLKEEYSVKSFTVKNNNDSSLSSFNNNDNNFDNTTTNQQSKDNQNLNEKIVKLFIGNHPLISMKTIKKITHFNFINKYLKNEFYYDSIIIDHIIHNDPGHIVAEFKDFLIMGDINEFLQNYYLDKESKYLLPKIYEYYISCSVIFPNYVILPESQYIYKNIQKKQRVIDVQQEQEDKEENIKKGLIKEEKEEKLFDTQILDSILNQTDTSGIKQYFGVSSEGNSLGGQLSKIIDGINFCEKNKISHLKPRINKINNCLYKNSNKIDLNDSFFENKKKEQKSNGISNINKKEKDNKYQISKNLNYLNKNNFQLSSSIKIINDISLKNINNRNNLNNGNSLKNIISRNKHYNKTKKEIKKENKKIGRNCLGNFIQENNCYTTTNSNGGFNNIINNTINSKCNTSRQKNEKEKNIIDIIKNKSKKLNKSKNIKRNLYSSDINACNPRSLNIIKKSLINSLLNSKKDIEIKKKIKKSNSRKILNINSKSKSKESLNSLIFKSITKNSLNNSQNKSKSKKEFNSKNNENENKNNESEYLLKNKHKNHLFSGFTKNEKNLIYQRKKNNDISSYYNKNKLSTNSSIKNIKIGKTKNNSSNKILGYLTNNNLSTSNLSYSIKNKTKYKYKDNQKMIKKKNETKNIKETSGNSFNKENNYDQDNEIQMNENKLENQNDEYYNSNGNNNFINKEKEYKIKNKPNKGDKSNNNNNSAYNGIDSYNHKIKSSISNNYMKKTKDKKSDKFIKFNRNMEKKISETNLSRTCLLNSPKNSLPNKNHLIKSDLRKKLSNEDIERPLTVRESAANINDINTKVIEILTNKINKIKQYMKESDKKNKNSISHIFKKKKIEFKNIFPNQINENVSENNTQLFSERTRNKLIKNKTNNTLNNKNDNIHDKKVKNIYINNNYINNKNKYLAKKKKTINDNINKNGIANNKKNRTNNGNLINHIRYNSNYDINGINYFSETNYNINFKHNKNKDTSNQLVSNINTNYVNNEEEKKMNIILLNNSTKSYSLKVLPIKQVNQNKIMVKGIKINGFEKLISKKYTTRNIDIPQYVTDRLKKLNGASSITNSNKYINTSNSYKTKFLQNKMTQNSLYKNK